MTVYPYIRLDSQESGDEQSAALAAVASAQPIVDISPPAERDVLIAGLSPGDMVLISEPSCLGADVPDARVALTRILSAGAAVRSVQPPLTLSPQHALEALQFVDALSKGIIKRQRRVATRQKPGRAGLNDSDVEAARRDWFDLSLSRQDVAGRYGVSWRTLYRQFGAREVNP